MATVIHEEPNEREVVREVVHHEHVDDSGGGVGSIVAVILLVLFLAIVLFYGVPMLRRSMNNDNVVPDTINVNLNGKLPGGTDGGGSQMPAPPAP